MVAAAFCFLAFFLAPAFDLLLDLDFALVLAGASVAWVVVAALAGEVTRAAGMANTAALIKVARSLFMVQSLVLALEKRVGLRSDNRFAICPYQLL